jgi:hypothetical protein
MKFQRQVGLQKVLKGHVNKYALLGLIISIASIFFATILVAYQMTGGVVYRALSLHSALTQLFGL